MSHVRVITQADEQRNRMADWTDAVVVAQAGVRVLSDTFRKLEALEATLAEHGYDLNADLGPIGNAARAAYKDMSVEPKPAFELPRSA